MKSCWWTIERTGEVATKQHLGQLENDDLGQGNDAAGERGKDAVRQGQ